MKRIKSNRPKCVLGAAIGAGIGLLGSIGSSIIGGASSAKAARKQRQLQAYQNAITTGQSYSDMLNSSLNNYDNTMYNEIAKYGKSKKKKKYKKNEIEAQDGELVYAPDGMKVLDGGMAIPVGKDTFLLQGSTHDEINESGKTGIGLDLPKGHIISDEPMFGNQSPANKVLSGEESIQDAVTEQDLFKRINNIQEPIAEHGKSVTKKPFFKEVIPYDMSLYGTDNINYPKQNRNIYRDTKLSNIYNDPYNNFYYTLHNDDVMNSVIFTQNGDVASTPINPVFPYYMRNIDNIRGAQDINSETYKHVLNTIRQPREFFDSIKANTNPFISMPYNIKLYPINAVPRKKYVLGSGRTKGTNINDKSNWIYINGVPQWNGVLSARPNYVPESIMPNVDRNSLSPVSITVTKPPVPLQNPILMKGATSSVTTAPVINNTNNFNTSAAINSGINALGSLATGLIGNYYLNKLSTPTAPAQMYSRKLKTNYNINPQITEYNNQLNNSLKQVNNNVVSSAAALKQYNTLNGAYNTELDKLYATKETEEAKLINQDLLNQQETASKNIAMYNDYLNNYNQTYNNIVNAKADNIAKTIGGIASAGNSYFDIDRLDKQNMLGFATTLAQAKDPEGTLRSIDIMYNNRKFRNYLIR